MLFSEIDRYVEENNVGGWLRSEERRELFLLAGQAKGVMVELGCYQGLSTLYLTAGGKSKCVFSVDNFEGPPDLRYAVNRDRHFSNPEAVRAKYIENIRGAGFIKLVTLIQMDSVAAAEIELGEVGLLFIDADHSYAGVLKDFTAWYPKVVSGGTVAMHNASGTGVSEGSVKYPGIMKVFAEAVLDGRLLKPYVVGTMGIGVKP